MNSLTKIKQELSVDVCACRSAACELLSGSPGKSYEDLRERLTKQELLYLKLYFSKSAAKRPEKHETAADAAVS
jgi:hypothetical protein